MGSASKGGPRHLSQSSYVVARESGLQGLQPHTVILGLKRPTEVRSACTCFVRSTDKFFGWMGCAEAQAHTCIHTDFQPGLMRIDRYSPYQASELTQGTIL